MPRRPVHPGEILMDELWYLNITPPNFAWEIGVSPGLVLQIIAGKRSITRDMAQRLAHRFGTSSQFWINLQSQFDVAVADERSRKVTGARMAGLSQAR